jgi:mRNA interferase MazF
MESIRRGDVFLVNFDPSLGAEATKVRPAVVVSNDINNAHSPIVSIAPVTSNVSRVYSFEVEVPAQTAGSHLKSKVMPNQIRTVDKVRLLKKIGRLPPGIMEKVDIALKLHYDLP